MKQFHLVPILLLAAFGVLATPVHAAQPVRISLLELYTSEGCNSCPPADRWVSSLPRSQRVPEKLVVLAFHVDYWNYLGWTDRFSQRRFTERQQAMVRAQNLRTAYTPQLLLNGRDFRGTNTLNDHIRHAAESPAAFKLQLNTKSGPDALEVSVQTNRTGASDAEPAELYVAVYENNLLTDVRAGENRGERLRHDYVVRSLTGPIAINGSSAQWSDRIPVNKEWKTMDLGVAAFVQAVRSGEVLQAVAQESFAK